MDNPELRDYIQDRLRVGETEQYIRTTLRTNGWPDKSIDDAFRMIGERPQQSRADITASSEQTLPKIAPQPSRVSQPTFEIADTQTKRTVSRAVLIGIAVILLAAILAWRDIAHNTNSARVKEDTSLRNGINDLAVQLNSYYATTQTYPTVGKVNAVINSSTARSYSYQAFSSTGDICNGDTTPCTRVIVSTKLSNGSRYLVVLDHNTESH